jgi:hypothetical protein
MVRSNFGALQRMERSLRFSSRFTFGARSNSWFRITANSAVASSPMITRTASILRLVDLAEGILG